MRNLLAILTFLLTILAFFSTLQAENIDHNGEKVEVDDPEACYPCHDDLKDHTHPVMIPYPPPGKENNYASPTVLTTAGIILLNGQVVCISCHDLGNPALNHPVEYDGASELCLVCHFK